MNAQPGLAARRPTPQRVSVRLRVDPVACDAYGFCAELLPSLVAVATRAAAECPRRAIVLEQVRLAG